MPFSDFVHIQGFIEGLPVDEICSFETNSFLEKFIEFQHVLGYLVIFGSAVGVEDRFLDTRISTIITVEGFSTSCSFSLADNWISCFREKLLFKWLMLISMQGSLMQARKTTRNMPCLRDQSSPALDSRVSSTQQSQGRAPDPTHHCDTDTMDLPFPQSNGLSAEPKPNVRPLLSLLTFRIIIFNLTFLVDSALWQTRTYSFRVESLKGRSEQQIQRQLQIKLSMKLKTPERANFSRYAKLCDQTFYHDSQPSQRPTEEIKPPSKLPRKTSTTGFSSVSREKRGNFRYSIYLPIGQFSNHPNHHYGKSRSPSWCFSKTEKYKKSPLVEYQVCEKHPLLVEDHQLKMRASMTSMKESLRDQVKIMHSTSYSSHKDKGALTSKETKHSRNYSIVSPRDTSSVGFFAQSKISRPRYLSKEDLNQVEGQLDEKHYQKHIVPSPNGYVEFSKRRPRHPNRNSKGFQTVLYPYTHEQQFNNYSETTFPTGPTGHVHLHAHLQRPDHVTERLGPNTQPFSIDFTRPSQSNIDLNLQSFRDHVTTRYDRVQPEPNTRLDYDAKTKALSGLLQMNRMQGRNSELFPIVDPAIKKAGDKEMKQTLKKCIPVKEINQAFRPKNVQNYTLMMQGSE